jgi:hypothetical protein
LRDNALPHSGELKRTEEALQEERNVLSAILETVGAPEF